MTEKTQRPRYSPEVRERLVSQGAEVYTMTPAEFGSFLRSDMEKWARVIREADIRVQ